MLSPLIVSKAGTFSTLEGNAYEGDLYKILDGVAYLRTAEEKIQIAITDLDAATQSVVTDWAEANPQAVEVYTKWDVQPRVKSTATPYLPEQFQEAAFKGMVSVDLVLNQEGQVIHASIKKSTHPELEAPSLEAAKIWLFEPAQVAGENVKAKLRVPFKFVYTPPVQEETPAS